MPDNLWTHNLALSDFLTGLVFFLMGFVILLQFFQYNKRSNLKLISTVWLLAVFGLLHGLAKWLNFFLTFIFFDITANSFHTWQTITVVITALSFIFLYLFGVELLVHTFKRFHYLRFTALIATFLWASIFLVSYHQENPVWLKQSTAWSYFLLAFPGAILVSLALITQIKDFTRLNIPKLSNAVYGATVSFTLYAVSTGAVFPRWQSFFMTAKTAMTIFPEPSPYMQLLRAVCGIGMAYFILKIMRTFNLEGSKKLELANISQAILEERDRISRDLHDGVIQSLYGVGLSLELIFNKTDPSNTEAAGQLKYILDKLDETTQSIRQYIQGLSPVEKHTFTLQEAVSALTRELSQQTNLQIQVNWAGGSEYQLTTSQVNHIFHIVQEALYNAAKHAKATTLKLDFSTDHKHLTISLFDNGVGLSHRKLTASQRGLRNIQERASLLGGNIALSSKNNQGTTLTIIVPWEGKQYAQNQATTG